MEALSWALTAASILLVFYAVRVTFQGRDPEKSGQQAGLGCGFFFLACLLWSLSASGWVGGYLNAFRLGLGIFLIWPAIGALTKPHGSRLFLGVVGLIAGIVLAGPVAKDLVIGYQNERENAPARDLQSTVEQLREREAELSEAVLAGEAERFALKTAIDDAGHADFDALSNDPVAMEKLTRLGQVTKVLDEYATRLASIRGTLAEAEAELTRIEEGTQKAETSAFQVPDMPSAEELTAVQEYARQKELEALFETEFE